ncbi:hypothetical protein LWC33_17295 [Pseudonocardia sp. RS11V-5]|uniref:hypothetical protein n=1 Tax=Pseudonocardia terrae TaxID=2905831 RepID=UPI001E410258|nr:hypothetical protein [Pseudonocardia terrae]MCE3553205.1 hypothetical protein [Pseudonocardia terrae]
MSTGSQGDEGPRYYPSGPSTGQYPQYPQNPYPQGTSPAGAPQGDQHPAGQYTGGQYAYSPYAQAPTPSADEPRRARRPATMAGALVLLVLSALPFLVFGVLGLFVPISQDMFPPELGLDAMLTQYNVSFDQFLQAVRLLLALVAVLALVYIGLAVAAFAGKAWGRVAVTVLTVLFCGFLLLNLGGGASSLIILAPVVLAVAGVVLMFVRPSAAWFAGLR